MHTLRIQGEGKRDINSLFHPADTLDFPEKELTVRLVAKSRKVRGE